MKEDQKIFKIALDSLLEGLRKTLPSLSDFDRMVVLTRVYSEQYCEYPGSHSKNELASAANKL
jgi:hypothetical protein